MRRPRGGQIMLLGDVLRAAFERASTTVFADRAALYLVGLKDEAGFALALAVHAKVPGPDPAILRERSQERGVREPMMVGAAPVEVLARVVEELGGRGAGDRGARQLLGFAVRELHGEGEVPVLVITDGVEVVSTLDTFAEEDLAELLEEAAPEVRGEPRKSGEDRRPRNEGTGGSVGAVLADDSELDLHGWVVSPGGEA